LNQTFNDFELIIVDDGSTDETSSLPLLQNAGSRLAYIRLPINRGVSAARNIGVASSTAPFLAFLDSDDEWLPKKLEKQIAWFNRHPDLRIVQTKEIWIRRGRRVNPPKTHEKVAGDLFRASLERCMITPSSVMLRRSLFDETGGFNDSLSACEDYDLWLRITSRYEVGLVSEYLLKRYGGHADQLSATVPMLDQYRVRSLVSLINSNALTAEQAVLARRNLVKRATILSLGFEKHGKPEEYERYGKIIREYQ
jgi:glycosyltransferase involved in cell wall biosynthesis